MEPTVGYVYMVWQGGYVQVQIREVTDATVSYCRINTYHSGWWCELATMEVSREEWDEMLREVSPARQYTRWEEHNKS